MNRPAWILAFALAASAVGCAGLLGLDATYQIPTCSVCGSDTCVDLDRDPAHCGVCDKACTSDETCNQGACVPTGSCQAGDTQPCYDGPTGTQQHTPCHAGTRDCVDGHWGVCAGEVTPTVDICGDGIDQNCDGIADNAVDLDGDGYTNCDGDCCDVAGPGCPNPAEVNPGAYDFPGDGIDQDCSGAADDPPINCDSGLASNPADGASYARAIDICQNSDAQIRNWGLIDAELVKADETGAPAAVQHSIRTSFGATHVQTGASMAVLATGPAAAPGQTMPDHVAFESGTAENTSSPYPADWLAAHGGTVPTDPGCPALQGTTANDPVMLKMHIRVPTNAKSFSLRINFMSAEYPEWVCTPYVDQFLVLLDSTWAGSPPNPPDKNIATYFDGTTPHAVNTLLAHSTPLFQDCTLPPAGCTSVFPLACGAGASALTGTGMDDPTVDCNGTGVPAGGGTGWLYARGNVVGGETITLRIVLWDQSDAVLDSLALLDGFTWSPNTITPGVNNQ